MEIPGTRTKPKDSSWNPSSTSWEQGGLREQSVCQNPKSGSGEMVQETKAHAAKSDGLSSVPGTPHGVRKELASRVVF